MGMILSSVSSGSFGKDVAKEIRDLKEHFSKKPIGTTPEQIASGGVDRSVAEQVHADLDSLIKRHDG